MTTTRTPQSGLLGDMTDADTRALRRLGDVVKVAPGSTIHPLGGTSRWFHCVLEGVVAVSDGGPPETGGPGTCFPEEALRGDLVPTRSSVVAVTESTVLVMGIREFHGALDTIPGFAAAIRGVAPRSEERTMMRNAARTATDGAGAPPQPPSEPEVPMGTPDVVGADEMSAGQ